MLGWLVIIGQQSTLTRLQRHFALLNKIFNKTNGLCYNGKKKSFIVVSPNDLILLIRDVTRLPSLMFNVLTLFEILQSPDIQDDDQLHCCKNTNCRELSTDIKRLCCWQTPDNCKSNMVYRQCYSMYYIRGVCSCPIVHGLTYL